MKPQLAGLTRKHGDKVVVLKVNVDRQRTLASMAGVRSIPDRRLFFGGRQLDRAVGGMSQKALERLVLKHEGLIVSSPQEEPAPVVALDAPLRKLDRGLLEVRSGNQLQWTEDKAASVEAAKDPAPALQKEAQLKSGTVEPMSKDWLPPGVTRVK